MLNFIPNSDSAKFNKNINIRDMPTTQKHNLHQSKVYKGR